MEKKFAGSKTIDKEYVNREHFQIKLIINNCVTIAIDRHTRLSVAKSPPFLK
jgi:hypothetical protein